MEFQQIINHQRELGATERQLDELRELLERQQPPIGAERRQPRPPPRLWLCLFCGVPFLTAMELDGHLRSPVHALDLWAEVQGWCAAHRRPPPLPRYAPWGVPAPQPTPLPWSPHHAHVTAVRVIPPVFSPPEQEVVVAMPAPIEPEPTITAAEEEHLLGPVHQSL
jgi:hypothetical protein